MNRVDKFCEQMRHWCCDMDMHYGQGNSNFPLPRYNFTYGGSTDCSAMVAHCLREAGYDVSPYLWSGNTKEALESIGWTCDYSDGLPVRGSVLINTSNHVATFDGSRIVEFGGDPHYGYRTVNYFYDYPWDVYMNPPKDWYDNEMPTEPEQKADAPEIEYCVSTDPNGLEWLPMVKGFSDFAGDDGKVIRWLCMFFPGWYQVKTERNGWLKPVTACSTTDLEYGCAGDGSPILAVRCYYETLDANETGWLAIQYQVAEIGKDWLSPLVDLDSPDGDDFAGDTLPIERFRARVVRC